MLNRNYGKIENGVIVYAPTQVRIKNTYYPKPTAEQYLTANDGPWKAIVNIHPPYKDGFVPLFDHYEETEGKIVFHYRYDQIPKTERDFNDALEKHLRDERIERGYDEREPSDYKDSSVSRWHQDAIDWIAHRDDVMLYGFSVLNEWKRTQVEPSYDEFVRNLPKIRWTYELQDDGYDNGKEEEE